MSQKHCSEEQLVGRLDGELSWLAERSVNRHLDACYRCRGRFHDLEQQALWLAKAVERDDFPGPARVSDAMRKFSVWEQGLRAAATCPRFQPLPAPVLPRVSAALAVLALIAVSLGRWSGTEPETPAQILARARVAEAAFLEAAVEQNIRVEFEQTRPRRQLRVSRLHVLATSDGGRFASRWEQDGSLRHALWRTGTSTDYVYDSAQRETATPFHQSGTSSPELLELAAHGSDPARLEADFVRWLESQQWRPVSLTAEMARFAGRDGVVLVAVTARTEQGQLVHRLTARRETAQRTAEVVVEIDAETLRPRLQTIRLVEKEQDVTLRFVAESIRRPDRILNSDFQPGVPLAKARAVSEMVHRRIPEKAAYDEEILPAPFTEGGIASREIEVLYVLHNNRACLGEPIEIERRQGGRVAVVGMTSGPERKEELIRALSPLESNGWLEVELRTVEEAVRESAALTSRRDATPAEARSRGAGNSLPLAEALAAHFEQRDGEDHAEETANRVRRFASEAVSRSEAVLADTWALARLAEAYGAEQFGGLEPNAHQLLGIMVGEHIESAWKRALEARAHFEPVLSAIIPSPAGVSPAPAMVTETKAVPWNSASTALLERVRRNHEFVLALFTVGYAPPMSGDSRDAIGRPEARARDLLGYWRHLDPEIRNLQSAIRPAFPAKRPLTEAIPIEASRKESLHQ